MNVQEARRYLELAEHDCRVLRILRRACDDPRAGALREEDTTDWQVALVYYILCIEVKALGCCRGMELQDHYTIKRWLNDEPELREVARPYRKAEEWSRDARYEGRRFDEREMRRYLSWFGAVHDHLARLLNGEGLSVPGSVDPRPLFTPDGT